MDTNPITQLAPSEEAAARESKFGRISELLIRFQREGVTGVVRIDTVWEQGIKRSVFLFQEGWVIYAGQALPKPDRFLQEISQHVQTDFLPEALDFAAKRSSVQRVVLALAKVGVVSWSEVAGAVRSQILAILTELREASGRACLVSEMTAFDLRYENDLPGFAIDELLEKIDAPDEEDDVRPVVLSVDDSPIVQTILNRHLGQDYQIVSCETAAEAIHILDRSQEAIDYLLLDLTLPDIDGLELCKTLRQQFKDLPIFLLTSRDGLVDRMRGYLVGADCYITKPCSQADLLAAMTGHGTDNK